MFLERNYRYLRLFLIVTPILVFFWLLSQDFAFSGRLDVSYDFSHDSPFVKRLWPPERLYSVEYDASGDAFQRLFVEPATFDVKLPRRFESATVELQYKKDAAQLLRVGIRMHPEKWAWEIRDLVPVREEGEWTVGRVRFEDLKRAPFMNRKLHFLVNAPGLFEEKREIAFTKIRIIFEKEPITVRNFFPRLWRYLRS